MDNVLETLFTKTPKCLAGFVTTRVSIALPGRWNAGPDFVTRSIKCTCGNEDLYLEAARHKELKGTCRQTEIITFGPPVYVGCSNCKRFTLLFDPLIHGWKAETDKDSDSDGDYKLMRCAPRPGKVYVNYSYRNTENYRELIQRSMENPEDYFDTFTILLGNAAGENIREIVASQCT